MIYRGQIEVNALDNDANDLNINAIGVKNGVNCSKASKNTGF